MESQIIEAQPNRSNMRPEINGPKKQPIAKHWDNRASAKPFLFEGAILKTISVDVGRNEAVPKLTNINEREIK